MENVGDNKRLQGSLEASYITFEEQQLQQKKKRIYENKW